MKGIVVARQGPNSRLELSDVQAPRLKAGELLIEVAGAGVNRTDIMTRERQAGYADDVQEGTEATVELGVEVSGLVVQTAGDSAGISVGDLVMGLVDGGGYAEYAVMPANRAMQIPAGIEVTDAAAIPEVFLTAYQTLFWLGKLAAGQTVLIHAGGSGVGTAAIQLAKQLVGAHVIVTAGSQEKLDVCAQLGADVLINYKETDFSDAVLQATDGRGADVILDFIGASYWAKNLKSIAKGGHWVLIGALGGSLVPEVQLFDLMKKYVTLTGTLLTPRSPAYKAQLTSEFQTRVKPYLDSGKIRPIIDRVFDLADAEAAQTYMLDNRNIGKILLKSTQ